MILKDWAVLGMSALNFVFVVWVFVQNRRAATRAEMTARNAEVDKQIARLDKEIALTKKGICAIPGDDDLAAAYARINHVNDTLAGRLDSVHGELQHVCGLVSAMARTVDNINVYLMERGK